MPPVQVVSAVVHLAVELLVVEVRLVAEEQLVGLVRETETVALVALAL